MTMQFDTKVCGNVDHALYLEWLCTNGRGGYASGSVAGANTRKYHGYLVVAMSPPVNRLVMLSRVEDRVVHAGVVTDLSTAEFPDVIHPQGYRHIESFTYDDGPVWVFRVGPLRVRKSIKLIHDTDNLVVQYELLAPSVLESPVKLVVQPMFAGRDFHATIQPHWRPAWSLVNHGSDYFSVTVPGLPCAINLSHNADKFTPAPSWWYNFMFRQERQRGYPDRDDLWNPGALEFTLQAGKPVGFICATQPVAYNRVPELLAQQARHHEEVDGFIPEAKQDPFLLALVRASDQFIVRRGPAPSEPRQLAPMSIIAGLPWFEDWGRDTFIALPGLTLCTGRFDIARGILKTYAEHLHQGLLPNRFPDKAHHPDYNTVDAAMWYLQSAYSFWRYTGDVAFLKAVLYDPMVEIIRHYRDGTDFDIRMDGDGLIRAGSHGLQLTWMDAKVGEWVVTPRHGKPVEINALWYNGLEMMRQLALTIGDEPNAREFRQLAAMVADSFPRTFWNAAAGYCHDVVSDEGKPDRSLRPNQLMAVCLPFSPLSPDQQMAVVNTCQKHLLTPMGMRTLARDDQAFHARCEGDQLARDMAYHQGTVWPWLIGPFVSAYVRAHGGTAEARQQARGFLMPMQQHMRDAGLGSISEIADAVEPFSPRGCIAQAWSVGEVLRSYYEDVLDRAPAWPQLR